MTNSLLEFVAGKIYFSVPEAGWKGVRFPNGIAFFSGLLLISSAAVGDVRNATESSADIDARWLR